MSFESSEAALAYFTEKKNAYLLTFSTREGRMALDDLRPFCRARESCVVAGDRDLTYVLEGRREVYLRIQDFLDRTPEELVTIFTKPLATRRQGDE